MHKRAVRVRLLFLGVLLGLSAALLADEAPRSGPAPITVLITWRLSAPGTPTLTLRVEDGRILSLASYPSGTPRRFEDNVRQDGTHELVWTRKQAAGTVALQILGGAGARVEVGCDGKMLRTTLLELAESPASISWSDGELQIQRPASDVVRVHVQHTSLVLDPKEELNVQYEFYILAREDEPVPTHIRLGLARSGSRPHEYSIDGRYKVIPNDPARARFNLKMRAPETPGVYEIVLRTQVDNRREIYRRVPFVVVAANQTPISDTLSLEQWWSEASLVASAENPGTGWRLSRPWLGWLNGLRQLFKASGPQPVSSVDEAGTWILHLPADESSMYVLELVGTGQPGEAALRLKLEPENEPHLLPGYAGPVQLIAAAPPRPATGPSQMRTCVALFPTPAGTRLKIDASTSTRDTSPMRWQLYQTPPIQKLARSFPSRLPDWKTRRLRGLTVGRLESLFFYGGLRDPSEWENEGASSWTAVYRASHNICSYAASLGVDVLFTPATQDGEALWPSSVIPVARTWDTDQQLPALAETGPRDIPELLFRTARSFHLLNVPVLDFGPQHRINPLTEKGQHTAIAALKEFLERYGRHENFPAVAVRLSPRAGTCLASLQDGNAPEVLQQFFQDSGLPVPAGDTRSQTAWVLANARERFIQWRCARIAALVESLLQVVRSAKPPRDLIVLLDFSDRSWADYLRTTFHQGKDLKVALRECGVALERWPEGEDLLLCRPYVDMEHSIRSLWINRDDILNRLLLESKRPLIAIHGPEYIDDRESPRSVFLPDQRNLGSGAVRAVAELDPVWIVSDGSIPVIPLAPLYLEIADLLRSIPRTPGRMQSRGEIVARSWADSQVRTWFLANLADYPVVVLADFSEPGQIHMEHPRGEVRADFSDGRRIRAELPADGFVLLRGPGNAELREFNVELPEASRNYLRARFEDLMYAVDFLRDENQIVTPNLLTDGGFEQGSGMGSRWEFVPANAAEFTSEARHSGQSGLRIRETGDADGTYVFSWPFTVPPGAEAVIRFYARSSDGEPQLSVWLVATDDPRRAGVARTYQLTGEWQEYEIRARELSPDQWSWRLVFRVTGGSADLDDVVVQARSITPEERNVALKSLAPAVKAWYEKRWGEFSSLTSEYWPQYLLRRFQKKGTH